MTIERIEHAVSQATMLESKILALKINSGGLFDYLEEAELHIHLAVEQLRGAIRFAEEIEADYD